MDIQGLVNHPENIERQLDRESPYDSGSSELSRFQHRADAGVAPRPHPLAQRDRAEGHSPTYKPQTRSDGINSPSVKRHIEYPSPNLTVPSKRRQDSNNDNLNGKVIPARRRALQACEPCRSRKSKCDNERPSCGCCIQHGVECVYKETPIVPVYFSTLEVSN